MHFFLWTPYLCVITTLATVVVVVVIVFIAVIAAAVAAVTAVAAAVTAITDITVAVAVAASTTIAATAAAITTTTAFILTATAVNTVAVATFAATAIAAAAAVVDRRRHSRLCRNIAVSVATTASATPAVITAATATVTVAPSLPVQSFFHPPALSSTARSRRCPPATVHLCRSRHRLVGSGAIICPFYSADSSISPSSSLEKCISGAAELRPPRRLSLRSRAASFDHPLCQVHVQLGRRAGWVGEHACLRSVRFPLRQPWLRSIFW